LTKRVRIFGTLLPLAIIVVTLLVIIVLSGPASPPPGLTPILTSTASPPLLDPEDDLREFAAFAYNAWSRQEWNSVLVSLAPADQDACTVDQLAAVLEADAAPRRSDLALALVEARGHVAGFVDPPAIAWRAAAVRVDGDQGTVTRRPFAAGTTLGAGGAVSDPWLLDGNVWWLILPQIAERCRTVEVPEAPANEWLADAGNGFHRSSRRGGEVSVAGVAGSRLRLTLVASDRVPSSEEGMHTVTASVEVRSRSAGTSIPQTFF
jgi:hypothetical protein